MFELPFLRGLTKTGCEKAFMHDFIIQLYIATIPFWEVICHSRVDNYFSNENDIIHLGISNLRHISLVAVPSCESLAACQVCLLVDNFKILHIFHYFL